MYLLFCSCHSYDRTLIYPLSSDEGYKRSYIERKRTPSLESTPHRTNSLDFHSDNEALKMLDEMQYFREQKYFCDVTIVVGEIEIEV